MGKLKFIKKDIIEQNLLDEKWKILIVDDEPEVHRISKSVLKEFVFENKKLEFLSAFSGKEALEILEKTENIAVILLDVVMETDDAGLIVAKKVREELHNNKVRIVLRTGQPGLAPEKEVLLDYDINDYKEKTELSSAKLFTTVVTAIRSYRDLCIIDQNKKGLKKIITASRSIFQIQSLSLFVEGVLTQLVSILNLGHHPDNIKASDAFFAVLDGDKDNNKFEILSTTGKFRDADKFNIMTPEALELLDEAFIKKDSFFKDNVYVGFFRSSNNTYLFLYLEGCAELSSQNKDFIGIFSNNISVAYENIHLHNEIINTQKEIILRLGSVVENRSKDVANHVNRVAGVSYILARAYGIEEQEARRIEMASPMHDIGKVAMPDSVLLKPDKLSNEEFSIIKEHSEIGHNILECGKREILSTASIIAHQHHERYDGTGYPQGLKGENIHIYGRITAIADVFDALVYSRVYKEAWPLPKVLDLLKEERGKHFDPKLVDIFFENLDQIKEACDIQ